MSDLKQDSKKRSSTQEVPTVKAPLAMNENVDLKVDGPLPKRPKIDSRMEGLVAGTAGQTAAAALQQSAAKNLGVANGIPNMVVQSGNLANVAAAASLMGPLGAGVPPGHLVAHSQILAGQNTFGNAMQGLAAGNHNQIKAFLDHISLGQYWRLLSENGCDTLEDLATADVQMLVNLGFKIFHANRLVTAVHRFIRPAPPVLNTPSKRKRASHVRTFAEMYQRVEEFQNLVTQVGSMSAAERDPRSTISRGAYTQYLRIKELAEKENINLTDEKYVTVKPTEKNVKEIILKEKGEKALEGESPSAPPPPNQVQQQQNGSNNNLPIPPVVPNLPQSQPEQAYIPTES
mmetsp:Transcript_23783/g.33286  ORF Transcript_23783/g.33286 Transcript_23783/m.33286 type:complete len:346 (+) Transcript_23783:75-1112(+)